MTPAGMVPRLKQFTVVGVFESGHYEYDSTLANPLLKVSTRITQMSVSSPIVSPITVQTAITPHRPQTAIRRGPSMRWFWAS